MIARRTSSGETIASPSTGTRVTSMVLNIDLAPSVLDICGAAALKNIHGRSWKCLLAGETADWRRSWYYEYNYEKQFPYTPNVRGVRTDQWKYIHYPHGDGKPDRHKAELYDLANDPHELRNLIDARRSRPVRMRLQMELRRLMKAAGALPDKMPLDEGIKKKMPDPSIQ